MNALAVFAQDVRAASRRSCRNDVRRRKAAPHVNPAREIPRHGLQAPRAGAAGGEGPAAPARQRVRLYAKSKRRMTRVDGGESVLLPADVVLVAAALIVDATGNILITRRPPGKRYAGFWEFPGGKVTSRETPEDALARELSEELCIQVPADKMEKVAFATAVSTKRGKHLVMLLYCVSEWGGEPRGAEDQGLLWVAASALAGIEFTDMHKSLAELALGFLDTRRSRGDAPGLAQASSVTDGSGSAPGEAARSLLAETAAAGSSAGG